MTRLEQELKKANRPSKRLLIIFFLVSVISGIAGGFFYWMFSALPEIKSLEEYAPMESSAVYSSDGKLLTEFYVVRRTFVPYYMIPEHLKKAFLSVEDVRFYSHSGIDIPGILRALYHNILAKEIVEGGSTITQQLAKMLFLTSERSFKRKLKEALLSIQIERHYTKDEIIGLYLNQAYFGARAYGIEAASRTYFGKSVKALTIGEAALLASLPKAPSLYSPFKNRDRAFERRGLVLKKMLKHKFITDAQYESARREPVPRSPFFRKFEAPYFVETLRQLLEAKYADELYVSGYKIYTTLDSSMQAAAEDAVRLGIESIDKRVTRGVQAALIALDPRTGSIKALVGGSDFWESQFNRATQAFRQSGSAFKPFVYLSAVMNGMTSKDKINDSPVTFKGAHAGQAWSPRNYDNKYFGMVTLKTALARSLNAATLRLADKIGIDNVIETAKKAGIKTSLQPYLSTALGATDITLMDMAFAYSIFATGMKVEPVMYEKIVNKKGVVIDESKPAIEKIIEEETVHEMQAMLEAVVNEGTAQKARVLGRTVYGKTGTTNNYTDAWFIGFDDRLVVGVWTGRDDHTPIGQKETGASAALPIWIEFMKKAGY